MGILQELMEVICMTTAARVVIDLPVQKTSYCLPKVLTRVSNNCKLRVVFFRYAIITIAKGVTSIYAHAQTLCECNN